MALPDTPLTRGEMYLNAIANESSDVPTPLTREEQFLSAIANKNASGLPPPLTREEQYLLAIASGDASGIPDIPLTRVEQYLGAIANGSDSYPSIPLTRMEQYLEYIAENGGGGGVPGSLEECGWVKELAGTAAVSGNLVDCPAGSSSTQCYIQPPASIHPSRYFVAGDELQLAIKVIEVNARCSYTVDDNSRGTSTSATGLFIPNKARGYASQPGTDIVTWAFTGTMKKLYFYPTSVSGNTGSIVSCKFEVTGLKFNGTVIYGKV